MCISDNSSCSGKKKASKKLELDPLSKNIIQSRTSDLSSNIFDQVITDIKASPLKYPIWRVISGIFT